jgi:hypothetical protein
LKIDLVYFVSHAWPKSLFIPITGATARGSCGVFDSFRTGLSRCWQVPDKPRVLGIGGWPTPVGTSGQDFYM